MLPPLLLTTIGLLLLSAVWSATPQRRSQVLVAAAGAGLAFQVLHTVEHLVQEVVWFVNPSSPPYLTPWAALGVDALSDDAAVGTELLHLVGNGVFLLALLALVRLAAGRGGTALRTALLVQSLHVAEHVALTVSTVLAGRPIGLTNGLGAVAAGPVGWAVRVNVHFAINAVATVAAVTAALALLRLGDAGQRYRSASASTLAT